LTSHNDERVLVIPSIFAGEVRKGFCTLENSRKLAAELIKSDQLRFMPRSEVEDDPKFLQLIPYVILYYYNPKPVVGNAFRVFTYCRGRAGGESRLTDKRSLGVGGHINDSDAISPQDAFKAGVWREIKEEVACGFEIVGSLHGTIYDDSDSVGRVHLGIVISFRLTGSTIITKDKSIVDPMLCSIDSLTANAAKFENWSRLIIDRLLSDPVNSPNGMNTDSPFILGSEQGPWSMTTRISVMSKVEKVLTALQELQTWIEDERDNARGGEGSFAHQDPAIVRGNALRDVSQKIDEIKTKGRSLAWLVQRFGL
jgi:predicted NUDIX family phosphoesterase